MASHSTVAHNFAHRRDTQMRGSNMYFENYNGMRVMYSYGDHFPFACMDGFSDTVLFHGEYYSNSTSKHQSRVSAAISHMNVIDVPQTVDVYLSMNYYREVAEYKTGRDLADVAKEDIEYWNFELIDLVGKQSRARTTDYSEEIISVVRNAEKYVSFFSVSSYLSGSLRSLLFGKPSPSDSDILNLFLGEDYQQELEAQRVAQKEREARALRSEIERFRNFKTDYVERGRFTYLRYDPATVTISTSKGVKIRSDEFHIAEWLYKNCVSHRDSAADSGQLTQEYSIAGWPINRITERGDIVAGCHIIPFSEIESISKQAFKGWSQ